MEKQMNNETGKNIDRLVSELQARKPLQPSGVRAVVWLACALALAAALFSAVQPFREGFITHLRTHPLLVTEIASVFLMVLTGIVLAFRSTVPGLTSPACLKTLFAAFTCICVATIIASFSSVGIESSTSHGGRAHCWLEVICSGAVTFTILIVMLRRGYPRFTRIQAALLAIAAILPGSALMQLACDYNPTHGVIFHYLPMLILAVAALLLQPFLKR